ncbi:Polyketide cyclase/dehydrase, partial [Cynara cardunculus var. scolymus]
MAITGDGANLPEIDYIKRHHKHEVRAYQCTSSLLKRIKAPVHLVWSLVRRFDQPQKYKPFVSGCNVQGGDLEIGSVREVNVRSGLPATTSTERLELLNEEEHILGMRIVGGDHRLQGNTTDETCYFVEALVKCNLKSLADVSERLAVQDSTESIVQ